MWRPVIYVHGMNPRLKNAAEPRAAVHNDWQTIIQASITDSKDPRIDID